MSTDYGDAARIKSLLKSNRQEFIETFLTIKAKDRNVVPFKLNPIQADMATTGTNSDIFVKPRQIGASEFFIADVTIETLLVPGTISIIVAHEEEATKRLLSKSDFFYNHLMSEWNWPELPVRHHDSEFKKTFRFFRDKDNPKSGQYAPPSTMYIASARSFVIARGDSYHNIIADEFAFWPNPEKLYELLGGRTPNSRLIILSTPNGEDNLFCEMYRKAQERQMFNDNVYTPHFYSWLQHPEYSLTTKDEFALQSDRVSPLLDINTDEFALMSGPWKATENQIRWRRYKIAEMEQMRMLGETRVLFTQEFPEDDNTCFLTFGDMAYEASILNEMLKKCEQPIRRTVFGADVWFEPEVGVEYHMSIDPGLAKHSMTALTVWKFFWKDDQEWAQHCATIHGLYTPERTKDLAWQLGEMYNWAKCIPESNIGTLTALMNNYPNKYLLRDPLSNRQTLNFGWITTPRSKPFMVNALQMMLPNIITKDGKLLKEIRNMRVDPNNELKVFSTGLDDLHDSAAIAMVCRPNHQVSRGFAFNYGRRR